MTAKTVLLSMAGLIACLGMTRHADEPQEPLVVTAVVRTAPLYNYADARATPDAAREDEARRGRSIGRKVERFSPEKPFTFLGRARSNSPQELCSDDVLTSNAASALCKFCPDVLSLASREEQPANGGEPPVHPFLHDACTRVRPGRKQQVSNLMSDDVSEKASNVTPSRRMGFSLA
jgi:hypothetical protein